MNIAVIGVGIMPTKKSDGIPAFVAALTELCKHHNVTVYSFIPVIKQHPRIRIRCVPSFRMPQKLQYLYLGVCFLVDHLAARIDIIHAQSPFPAGVLSRRLSSIFRVPWILSFHAGEAAYMPDIPYGDLVNPFLRKVNTSVTQSAPVVVAMSEHQAVMIRENLAPGNDVTVLPRGMVVPSLKRREYRDVPTFLHVSFYQPVKDPQLLLSIFKHLSKKMKFSLLIAGGNYPTSFTDEVVSLGLRDNIKILGSLPHESVLKLMDEADYLIHTSVCEALPMVALEAMSRGVAVCGTAVGIMADLSSQYCVAVEDRNGEELASRIAELHKSPQAVSELRQRAWQWVSDHDMNWYINELTKCYHKAIDQG
jgi:glycosyltransferase involved in cell wall biosynthesis